MTTAELLTYLTGKGVVLWAEGDRLRYKAPKKVLTPELRIKLTECKSDILVLLRQSNASHITSLPPLQPISRDGRLLLSYAQHGLWLTAQATDHPPFNQPLAFRIGGPLNVAHLERSLNEIVRRHEILRTTCRIVGKEPVQVIIPKFTLSIETIDLRDLDPIIREGAVVRLATEEAQKPFDLAKGPLLRGKLFQMENEEYVFILTIHTFVADGYSHGILLRELGKLYEAFSKNESSPLTENQIQFVDYADWQRRLLQGEYLASQLSYWKQRLRNSPSMLTWPVGNIGHTVPTYRGETKYFSLPWDLSESIRVFSRREGVTIFTVLLASLKTLLYRLTRQTDLIVGITVSNRSRSEIESLIGYFANNLAIRTQISGQLTFRELLNRCHEVVAGGFANMDYPFEKLLEELSIDPEIFGIPLLQVVFILHDHVVEEDLQLPGLRVKRFPVQRGAAIRDLQLHMANTGGLLSGALEYSTDLFDEGTIERILGHFQTLLKCVVAEPQQSLENLPFLSKDEREELIRTWSDSNLSREANTALSNSYDLKHRIHTPDVAPQNEIERIIASIWREILKIEELGIHKNFFDLGARSIHIIQVHSRLRKLLKRDISIIDLFRYPTTSLLSQHLSREQGEQPLFRQSNNRVELRRALRERRLRARTK